MNKTLKSILDEHLDELPMADAYVFGTSDPVIDQLDNLLDAVELMCSNFVYEDGRCSVSAELFDKMFDARLDLNS